MYGEIWFEDKFLILKGTHKLEWIYKKFNVEGTSDDLSAEIETITITGVKSMNKECQSCSKGKANEAQN
jgi:hypothetical protein